MAEAGKDRKIDYIEFVVADLGRARAFYGGAFGWSFTEYGPDYLAFNDGRLDGGFTTEGKPPSGGPPSGKPSSGGSASGAPFSVGTPGGPPRVGPLVILFADDLEGAQRKVETAGGTILKPIYPFPGGRRFHFADPDGYELAIWSDK